MVKSLLIMWIITVALKTTSKRAIEKPAEATGDLVSNKIADKTASISKKPAKKATRR